jgi:hypothetical protein
LKEAGALEAAEKVLDEVKEYGNDFAMELSLGSAIWTSLLND